MSRDLFEMYKASDIVYPSVVARFYKEPIGDAYDRCDARVGKDLRKTYMVKCPHCGHYADTKRYYAVVDIPKEEIRCAQCDTLFIPNTENDALVLYEKVKAGKNFFSNT